MWDVSNFHGNPFESFSPKLDNIEKFELGIQIWSILNFDHNYSTVIIFISLNQTLWFSTFVWK